MRWTRDADRLVDDWSEMKAATFAAFCRKSGKWRPVKGDPDMSWNKLIQNVMADVVAEGFNEFEEELVSIFTQTSTDASDLFRSLITKLEGISTPSISFHKPIADPKSRRMRRLPWQDRSRGLPAAHPKHQEIGP